MPPPAKSAITLGVRSSSGTKRLSPLASSTSGAGLRSAIAKALNLTEDFQIRTADAKSFPPRPNPTPLKMTRTATLQTLGLKNGDTLFVSPLEGTRFAEDKADEAAEEAASSTSNASAPPAEDDVDLALWKEDGRVEVGKTPNCQHASRAQKCIYCAPREPYDDEHMKKEGIKHMSFHAYLRKLSDRTGGKKFAALDDLSCRIKPGCTTHRPWPESICSKCQPPAVTLNRQTYRHVDNIMFENPDIVDAFLSYWRASGNQRIGFLYGRYEVFPDVPLGIKAVVAAIYEPPQENSRDSVKLIPSEEEESRVSAVARQLGLQRVGWIFTDLLPDSQGQVRHFRNMESHFLSAQECLMAGHFQSQYPNPCRRSSSGVFGSKFCTVLVTGNKEQQVHMEGYQVSNQCMALSRDQCLVPTKDAPELGYVRESSAEQYVPDVFFKEKDKYGNEVTKVSRPLPVEYLLVDVPVSTPKVPVNTFHVTNGAQQTRFPVENRPMETHIQDFGALASYRKQFKDLADFFRDFHLLLYLATQTVNPLYEHMGPLLEAVKDRKSDAVLAWANSEHWQTIELLLEAHNGGFQ